MLIATLASILVCTQPADAVAIATPRIDYVAKLNEPALAVPEEDRAWPVYERAFDAMEWPVPEDLRNAAPGGDAWPGALAYLDRNARTLELLREGAKRPHLGRVLESETTLLFDVRLDHLGLLRRATDLLRADALRAIEQGDTERALIDIQTIFSVSEHVNQPSSAIAWLCSIAIAERAADPAERLAVDADKTEAQLVRLLAFLDRPTHMSKYASALAYERDFFADVLQHAFAENGKGDARLAPDGPVLLARLHKATGAEPTDEEIAEARLFLAASASRNALLEEFDLLNEEAVTFGSTPLYLRGPRSPDALYNEKREDAGYTFKYPLVGIFKVSYDRSILAADHADQTAIALRTACAIALFNKRNGEYPLSLDALVPECLPSVPIDTHTGEPLIYRVTDDGFLLYSRGNDRDDDGGAHNQASIWHRPLERSSDGDWVLWPRVPLSR